MNGTPFENICDSKWGFKHKAFATQIEGLATEFPVAVIAVNAHKAAVLIGGFHAFGLRPTETLKDDHAYQVVFQHVSRPHSVGSSMAYPRPLSISFNNKQGSEAFQRLTAMNVKQSALW